MGAMDGIASDLGARQRAMDLLAGATETVLETESARLVRSVRKLPRPSDSLALSLRHQLGQMAVAEPVACLRVTVPDLRRVPVLQRALDSAESCEALRSALASVRELCAMYGDGAVRQASAIELPRREQVLKAWRDAHGWK
jgi:hypothetical protein